MTETLTTTIESTDPVVVRLRGDLNRDAAPAMEEVVTAVVASSPGELVLDFAATRYIDSSGIALIVDLLARTSAQGIRVHASGVGDHYRHVFEITRLTSYLTIHDREPGESNE